MRLRLRGETFAGAALAMLVYGIANAALAYLIKPVIDDVLIAQNDLQGSLSRGQTAQTRQAAVDAKEKEKPVVALPATSTVEELVKALNLIGSRIPCMPGT